MHVMFHPAMCLCAHACFFNHPGFLQQSLAPSDVPGMPTAAFLGLFCGRVCVQSVFMVWDHMKRCHPHAEPYSNTEKNRWPHIS